jgi:hypothetical protein
MINRRFLRHYAEMVIAMVLGMVVLGIPGEAALRAFGTSSSELHVDAPAVVLLGMAVTMTVPMVAWMRFRGHGWGPSAEMGASMMVPTLAIVGLLGTGIVTDFGTLMTLEHVVMFPAMFGVMLLRPEEYSGHHHHEAAAA